MRIRKKVEPEVIIVPIQDDQPSLKVSDKSALE
jgi:hypothetical protein